ncbi:MAG TPA: hypothetical protein PLX33_10450 [Alphaproteobacteria bacterium]|nr:hypothetical protein [Alphaproteobacteria bacterium]
MTDQTKAALDALERIHNWSLGRVMYDGVTDDFYRLKQALTAPPAPVLPQPTDAQKRELLDDMRCQAVYSDKVAVPIPLYERIKTTLQPPAVPRGLTALIHDADSAVRGAQTFINMSGQKDLNEIQNATAWLNTAKENCIKALALLGGKEGRDG